MFIEKGIGDIDLLAIDSRHETCSDVKSCHVGWEEGEHSATVAVPAHSGPFLLFQTPRHEPLVIWFRNGSPLASTCIEI